MDTSPHQSDFVSANGIRLHYLDWGGNGPALLFLAGMGCNAHIFDRFAPRFTGRFHVLALTRRGHGQSDHPETGYDIDTLTGDIRSFLDALKIDQVILAGHSLAGVELSHFAALHPDRLLKLVYLDAAFYRNTPEFKRMLAENPLTRIKNPFLDVVAYSPQDYFSGLKKAFPSLAEIWGSEIEEQGLHEITLQSDGKVVDRMTPAIEHALDEMLSTYAPEDALIRVPTLSFFAFPSGQSFISPEYMSPIQQAQVIEFIQTTRQAWLHSSLEQFRRNVPHARIVEIPAGHHYCFIQQAELVEAEMQRFL
jgi:non-heme chloroperoxidase